MTSPAAEPPAATATTRPTAGAPTAPVGEDAQAAARAPGAETSLTAAAPAAAAPERTSTWNQTMFLQKEGVGANDILGAARVVGLGWMSPGRLRAISGEWLFGRRRGPHTGEVVLDLSTGHWRRIDDVHGHHGIFDIANVHSSVGDFGAVDGDTCLVAGLLAEDEGRALLRACARIQRQWRLTGRARGRARRWLNIVRFCVGLANHALPHWFGADPLPAADVPNPPAGAAASASAACGPTQAPASPEVQSGSDVTSPAVAREVPRYECRASNEPGSASLGHGQGDEHANVQSASASSGHGQGHQFAMFSETLRVRQQCRASLARVSTQPAVERI